jgi:uroporphyrinogen decarboxylase
MSNTQRHTLTGRERMLAALDFRKVDRPPVWFMRQAGRHLPGYRQLRERHSFVELCNDESLNLEVSAEPWRRYGVDGAIVFNDILSPLMDMGMGLEFVPGPRFDRLITTRDDVARLRRPEFDDQTAVYRCIAALRETVGNDAAVLGFVGAPMTVSAFAVRGAGSQCRGDLTGIIRDDPSLFISMQETILPVLADYAALQVRAGADLIQIFESLAEELPEALYREVGLPRLLALIALVRQACPETPIITFGRGLGPYIPELSTSPSTALSIDPTMNLWDVRRQLTEIGSTQALQGNLPPEVLLESPLVAGGAASSLLARWREIVPFPQLANELGPTGWVFNLGHGVPAGADPAAVESVMEVLRAFSFGQAPAAMEAAR